jgi:hypothetical protein
MGQRDDTGSCASLTLARVLHIGHEAAPRQQTVWCKEIAGSRLLTTRRKSLVGYTSKNGADFIGTYAHRLVLMRRQERVVSDSSAQDGNAG